MIVRQKLSQKGLFSHVLYPKIVKITYSANLQQFSLLEFPTQISDTRFGVIYKFKTPLSKRRLRSEQDIPSLRINEPYFIARKASRLVRQMKNNAAMQRRYSGYRR